MALELEYGGKAGDAGELLNADLATACIVAPLAKCGTHQGNHTGGSGVSFQACHILRIDTGLVSSRQL
jgi:hypothetical protein